MEIWHVFAIGPGGDYEYRVNDETGSVVPAATNPLELLVDVPVPYPARAEPRPCTICKEPIQPGQSYVPAPIRGKGPQHAKCSR